MIKIAILGLGGVGGFYGGKLAKQYENSNEIEIYFFARGAHLEEIKKNGLKIVSDDGEFIARPKKVTNNPGEIGIVDYLIVSTKSYDLNSSMEYVRPCIDEKTVILPLLNGGIITEQIRDIYVRNVVWSGCSYIVSRKSAPGVITQVGDFSRLIFGYDKGENEQIINFAKIMTDAGIDAILSENARETIWKKYYFISVTASLTSYFDVSFNEIVQTEERLRMTKAMATEFIKVAKAEGIDLGVDAVAKIVRHASTLPKGTTTSMHSDFMAKHKTEVDNLTGIVVELASKHNIDVPLYKKVYKALKERENLKS